VRRIRARVGAPHGEGGSGSPAYRVSAVPVPGAVYGLRHWAQKGQGEEMQLTEGPWRLGLRRREEDDGDRRRRGSGSRGEGRCRGDRALWVAGIGPGGSCEGDQGLR
jgi:hypothetical protein